MKKTVLIKDIEDVLIAKFNATISSIEEINRYKEYNVSGDNEHDYNNVLKVYKLLGKRNKVNFMIVFGKNNVVTDFKYLGEAKSDMYKYWDEWA